MSRRAWLVVALLVGVVVIAAVVVLRPKGPVADADPTATPSPTVPASVTATPTAALSPSPSPTTEPTPTPTPEPTPVATATPKPNGDARLRYAEFLLRVNDDRAKVEDLNAAVRSAAEAQDPDAVRVASVDILDFVDTERDWLREHPPASCYADAHAAANDMLAAYATAAERFIDWTTAEGLDRLVALTDALDAADQAGEALTAFGQALEATTCRA